MTPIFLASKGGLLGPIASLLGIIMDGIFRVMSSFGIVNIGVCIIIFTIVTRILMMPLSYKQAKSRWPLSSRSIRVRKTTRTP